MSLRKSLSRLITRARGAGLMLALAGLLAAPLGAAPLPKSPLGARARITLSADGTTVYIIGAIMDDSFLAFDALLLGAPKVRTVYLDSPGGLTIEGRLIAALVRKRGLSTYVEHYCASACTQVFVAGRERILGPEGELGFHQAVKVDEQGETSKLAAATTRPLTAATVFGVNGNDTLRLAYELAGIDSPFIAKVLAREHDEMWVPSLDELRQSHVITRRADRSELALPPGSLNHAQVRALLEPRPMWRAAAAVLPAAYLESLNDTWRRANGGTEIEAAISAGRAAIVLAAWPVLATASDSMLDRMLSLYAGAARDQRARSYPMCQEKLVDSAGPIDPADRAFEAGEDQLLVEMFSAPVRGPGPSVPEAHKVFARDVVPGLLQTFSATDLKSTAGSCRLGFKIFEAIDQLPAKKRIKAYRALLTLPEMAGG